MVSYKFFRKVLSKGDSSEKIEIIFKTRVFLKFHKWNEECHRLTVSRDGVTLMTLEIIVLSQRIGGDAKVVVGVRFYRDYWVHPYLTQPVNIVIFAEPNRISFSSKLKPKFKYC